MLRFEDLNCGYHDKVNLVADAHSITKGSVVFLIGENGSGKSTFLKALAGIIPPIKGNIFFENLKIQEDRYISERPGYLPSFSHFFEGLKTSDLFELYDIKMEEVNQFIFEDLDVLKFMEVKLSELSAGERQRVLLAATLSHPSRCFLLDEPFSYLDARYSVRLTRLINKLSKDSIFVIASHDFNWILKCPNSEVWLISNSKITLEGQPKDIFTNPIFESAFGLKTQLLYNQEGQLAGIFVNS